jgi:ribosome-associated translation inhibitor RaiA
MEVKTKGKDPNSEADEELKLGGNIILVGFSLEPVEMIVVKKIIGNYVKKIGEHIDYQDIKISLRKTEKAQSFSHEIEVSAKTSEGLLTSDTVNNNLYTALSDALEKVFNQAEHKERTSRQK